VLRRGIAVSVIVLLGAWALLPRAAYPHNPTTTTVLFNREITALLQRKCVHCHADGKMAMPLVTYAQTRPWAEAIKEEALARRMPPWPAERGFGSFSNDVGLTPREFEFLISWIDGGVPEGTGASAPAVDHSAHWMLGNPDLVIAPRRPVTIERRSAPAFTRVTIDTGLTRDTWVRGFDFKPDVRVTRAAFLSLEGSGQYLGGWTPWQSSTSLPNGVAFRIPARARIAVDVLYSGTADTVTDSPKLGLYTTPAPTPALVTTSTLRPSTSSPSEANRITADLKVASEQSVVSLRPEMQDGARSLEVTLLRADGSRAVLLWIKQFRQQWQTPYVFDKPVTVPAGSLLRATAYFDAPPRPSTPPFSIAVNHYEKK
jgi:hypothetical protein